MANDPAPRKRWKSWLFVASLGLNVAVIGLVAGLAIVGPDNRGPVERTDWVNIRVLPEPYRSDLGREIRTGGRDLRETRRELRLRRQELAGALTAQPFEIERVQGILDAEHAILQNIAEQGIELLVVQIGKMSDADRAAYAEAIMNARSKSRRHDSGKR